MKKVEVIILCGLFLFTSCKQEKIQKDTVKIVKVDTVVGYGENKTVSFPGRVKASSEINLAFRISGPILKINVKEGEYVREGQVLAEMDSRDYAIQFSATEAEYKQIKSEAERIIKLYEKQSVSENDYDKAVAGLQQITAKYNSHKNALSDTKLISPFNGYVQKRYFDKDETVSAGMPVFALISTGAPEVVVNIPAGDFIQRDKFDSYSCTFDVYPGEVFPLELISVSQKANLNQLYTVRLKIREKPNMPVPSPGMSTMVTIGFRPEDVNTVYIPISALFETDGKPSVWVYDKEYQNVRLRNVRLSEILTDGTVVVSEGLKAGETVVSAGVHSLTEGENVRLLPEASSTNVGGLL